jgi:tetratricopeptide (TPR) repeat protein
MAFVNLQYGECAAEIEQARREFGANLHDWPDANPLDDLDGPAAQIAALDLVISVDNAAVHLAGALNVPVWTLLPFASDWRWFTDPSKSHWYPSMRLFRQQSAEGASEHRWDGVFNSVARALTELALSRAADDYDRGTKFHEAGQLAEAIDCLRRSAALKSDDARTLNNLGVAWKEAGRADLAEAAYQSALSHDPDSSTVCFNLGNARREENRLEDAVACYQRALEAAPRDHRILVNLAVALKDLHRFSDALACLNRVLASSPELPAARFDRSLIWLTQGNLGDGWDEYEWRLESEPQGRRERRRSGLTWAGRSLRIMAEQGIGDQVMFASGLAEASQSAKSCVVECEPRLAPLFARSFPNISVVPTGPAAPGDASPTANDAGAEEVVEFIGSLARFLRRRIEDFPARVGYLKADPLLVAERRARLSSGGGGFKVGIAWRGGKDRETQNKRSIPLEAWGPVFQVPGIRFFNLQHGPAAAEAGVVRNRFGVSLDDGADCDPLTDLDDFCAKIAALDLIISADNSTVHLAGALGRPVWTLLPFSADWRWMLETETTPWYPTMRLVRCRLAGDWPDVMRRTARLLAAAAFGG